MAFSQSQTDAPARTQLFDLRGVILLCLPTIIGSGWFLAAAVSLQFPDFNPAPPIDFFRQPSLLDHVLEAVGLTVFVTCYFAAMFGPLVLPLALWQAVGLTRSPGVRWRTRVCAWVVVVLGLTSAALYWGWASQLDVFI